MPRPAQGGALGKKLAVLRLPPPSHHQPGRRASRNCLDTLARSADSGQERVTEVAAQRSVLALARLGDGA